MSIEIPATGRAVYEELGNEVRISVPTRRKMLAVIISCIWLAGWVVGETFAFRALLQPMAPDGNKPFLMFWLTGWTIAGLFAFTGLFWILAGREIVTISSQLVTIRWDILGLGFQRQYDMTQVQNMRVAAVQARPTIFEMLSMNVQIAPKTLAFDYGMKTVRFAGDIDEAEASFLLEKLNHRFRRS